MTVVCGIDPGSKGALVLIEYESPSHSGKILDWMRMPGKNPRYDYVRIMEFMSRADVVALEHVTRGSSLVRNAFSMWGIAFALDLPISLVLSSTWKPRMGLPKGGKKSDSVELAARLYPGIESDLYGPKGGLQDGLAEAILIAEDCSRHFLNKQATLKKEKLRHG